MASNTPPSESTRIADPYENRSELDAESIRFYHPIWPNLRWKLLKASLFCIFVPLSLLRKRRKRKDDASYVEFNERLKGSDPPEPLPSRRRALTLPGDAVSGSGPGSGSAQQQSLFFSKLPLDIRYMIYQYVSYFSGRRCRMHLINFHRHLRSYPCAMQDNDDDDDGCENIHLNRRPSNREFVHGWKHYCWGDTARDGTSVLLRDMTNPQERHPNRVWGLLCSCRRVYATSCKPVGLYIIFRNNYADSGAKRYSEAIDLLYTINIFNVRLTRTIVDMQRCIPPQRFRMIRSLELDVPLHALWGIDDVHQSNPPYEVAILTFWDPAWAAIKEMQGLLTLKVSISSYSYFYQPIIDHETLTHLLRPMMAVRHVRDFALDVCLPLPDGLLEETLRELGGDPPFSLEVKVFRYLMN